MSDSSITPPAPADAVQTAVLRSCEICDAEIQGDQKDTCSDKCRAERWRRRREQDQRQRDAKVRALLTQAVGCSRSEAHDRRAAGGRHHRGGGRVVLSGGAVNVRRSSTRGRADE